MAGPLGLIGGMTWAASALYYERLNRLSNARLGGSHTLRVLIDSLDFGELERLGNREGDWVAVEQLLVCSAQRLESAGAVCLLLGAHTAHLMFDAVAATVRVPVLHVADPLGRAAQAAGVRRLALLGTRHVANSPLFPTRLARLGVEIAPPHIVDAAAIDALIFGPLAQGRFDPAGRAIARRVIEGLPAQGFDACGLCCTELPVLLRGESFTLPVFDTVELHAGAALDFLQGYPA